MILSRSLLVLILRQCSVGKFDGTLHYDIPQKIFMDALPADMTIYNEYHALIVALCKDSCHKSACGEI
ncbi:MAG: hypothetical protein J6T08_08170 [Lentisphaeria bacterium]|nr:hypothetical protein [Lentisphaeria bacterium]